MAAKAFKNIIITGASSGLGEALAKQMAAPGMALGLLGRNPERLEAVAGQCLSRGCEVTPGILDVTSGDRLREWLLDFDKEHPVDLVIANAGIINTIARDKPIESLEEIKNILNTNFFGALETVNPVLELMMERKAGHAAIISSLSAYRGIPRFPAYSASKAAVKVYYDAIRGSLARQNVTVSVACPSFIMTPMNEKQDNKPYMQLSVDKAAAVIIRGLQKRKATITFPIYHLWGLKFLGLLPVRLADRILMKSLNM